MKLLAAVTVAVLTVLTATAADQWTGDALAAWSKHPTRVAVAMRDGIMELADIGVDCNLQLDGLEIDSRKHLGVEFEYRATGLPDKTTGEIFFIGDSGQYRGPFILPSLKSDGQWHTVMRTAGNLRDPGSWATAGTIRTLRFDPINQAGGKQGRIEIKSIALMPMIWTDTALQDWSPHAVKTALRDGILELTGIGRDCNIQLGNLDFPARDYAGVEFEYRAAGLPDKTTGQIFFIGDRGKYQGPFMLPSLKSDGQWHTVKMTSANLQNCTEWETAGSIRKLRLDPMDQAGGPDAKIEIRSIRLIPVAAPSGEPGAENGVTLLRVPPTVNKPVIDGKFTEREWYDTSAQFGGVSNANGMLSGRWMSFFFGYDDEFIYFAQRSALPPPPMKLSGEDTLELIVGFPGSPVKSFTFNFDGRGNLPADARLENWVSPEKLWYSELAIPLKAFGITAIPYGKECRFQVIRHFRNRHEDVRWHAPTPGVQYGVMIPEKDIPRVKFPQLWLHLGQVCSSYKAVWSACNHTAKPADVHFDISMVSIEQPRLIDTTVTIAPKAESSASLDGQWAWDVIRHLKAEISDAVTGKVYSRRYFSWDIAKVVRWQDPDPPFQFKIAVYPTARRFRYLLSCPNRNKFDKLTVPPEVVIVNADGRPVAAPAPTRRAYGYAYDGVLPALPDGKYTVRCTFKNTNGKSETLSDNFTLGHFEWQNQRLGMARIVVPPFKPLQVDGPEIRALQTGFREAGNGFWEKIYAQGENILAKPVELTVNGRSFTPVAERELEKSPDLVIRETDLKYQDLTLTVRREYEQDGFCKVTLKFDPARPVKIDQLDLNFPLRKDLAKFYFASGRGIRMNVKGMVPDRPGVCLDSTAGTAQYPYLNGFRPYIWLGEFYKGLAYVCETPHHWGRATGKPSQEITVDGDAVRLRLHLAAGPITYAQPCSIVLAFQPTPVKPKPAGARCYVDPADSGPARPDRTGLISSAHNSIFFRYDDGMYVPPRNDWSYIDFALKAQWHDRAEVVKFVGDYIDRNGLSHTSYSPLRGPTSWWMKCPMDDYLIRNAVKYKNAAWRQVYANSRVICHTWPEFEVFADEWDLREWRPPRELNEFSVEPVPSYIDFSLYRIRDLIRHGMAGTYFDNVFESLCRDPVTSAAFEDENGNIHPAFGIFALRDLVKRTAIMMHQEGKSFHGYPPIMLHMTDCPLVPVLSFAGMQLDWEMQFGGDTYQHRFPPEYGYTATTGAQAGVFSCVLINGKGCGGNQDRLIRSLLAMTFIYDVMHHTESGSFEAFKKSPVYNTALDRIFAFGYGRPDTVVYPSWDPANPVKIVPSRVRATVARRADGALLLMIGNLGAAAEAQFDLGALGGGTVTDLISGKELGRGTRFTLPVGAEDYALCMVMP